MRLSKARVGESTREGNHLFHKRGSGDLPEKIFEFKMPLEAILMHVETIFACEIQSIL